MEQRDQDTPVVGLPDEARAFLESNPDIETVQLVITDANGVGRGKNIAREEVEALYRSGRNVAGSILGLDITGEDVEETGLVWAVGDADQTCRPVAGSLSRAPWLSRPAAQVLGTMFELDGRTAKADPRHALARAVERLQRKGLTPVVAVELEFYLLQRGEDGQLRPARGLMTGRSTGSIDAYGLGRLDDMSPLFDDLYAAARAQKLPVRTLMSEYAPGQFEITLEHRADALRAVDEAVLFKRAIRGVASRHGCIACFMAKPFEKMAGTGMHLHASLADEQGRNAFASDEPAGTPLLRHAIGGLRDTLADGMAVFAPHANSYRRFRAMSYAPVAPTWGVNNRSVSLRVPAGPAATSWRRCCWPACSTASTTASTPGHRSSAMVTSRRRAATCRRTGARQSNGPRHRSFSPTRSAPSFSECSWRSSDASTRSSARWSQIGTTSGTSTAPDRCNISRCRRWTERLPWRGQALSQANRPVCES